MHPEVKEEWRDIPGWEGFYQVSNTGRYRSVPRRIYLRPHHRTGTPMYKSYQLQIKTVKVMGPYLSADLYKGGKNYTKGIHVLVAMAFIPNPHNKPCVNHKDNNPHNNYVSNLEWATQAENIGHMVEQDRQAKGEKIARSKLTEQTVKEIRALSSGGHLIAKSYGISYSTLKKIRKRKTWKHI